MKSHMDNSNQNISRKMHLYSGHDITVGMVLGFFGNFIEMSDFGASIHLHLHFDEHIGYTIRVWSHSFFMES